MITSSQTYTAVELRVVTKFLDPSRCPSKVPVAFIVQNVYTMLLFNRVVCSTYKYRVFLCLLFVTLLER